MDLLMIGLLTVAVVAFFTGVTILVANIAGATFSRAGVSRGLNTIDRIYAAATVDDAERGANLIGNRIAQLGRATTHPGPSRPSPASPVGARLSCSLVTSSRGIAEYRS